MVTARTSTCVVDNVGMSDIEAGDGTTGPEANAGAVQKIITEFSDYLGLVFKPAAEQLGLIFFDQVQNWRVRNLVRLTEKVKRLGKNKGSANPRITSAVLEHAVSTDDDTLLNMWAGLLDSSRRERDPNDENIAFVSILSQMSAGQAVLFNHICSTAQKRRVGQHLLVGVERVSKIDDDELYSTVNVVQLDLDLDYLNSRALISGGILSNEPDLVQVLPTALGLYMYTRCLGSQLAPIDFFVLELEVVDAPKEGDANPE
jgi:hypothetical protein